MVEEVKAFKTPNGQIFEHYWEAFNAEKVDRIRAFGDELRMGLEISTPDWIEGFNGDELSEMLFDNPQLLNNLFNKYKLL